MAKYFQTDDRDDYFDSIGKKTKDSFRTYYRVYIDGKLIKESPFAIKQTRHLKDRVIHKRKYNLSKREWVDPEFVKI